MTTFNLPDLGEGLPEAEIVAWHVQEGDAVEVDQPMESDETAKAVDEVPSPYKGRIVKFHARPGDTVETGKPLVDFELAEGSPSPQPAAAKGAAPAKEPAQGMVVATVPPGEYRVVLSAGGREYSQPALVLADGSR